MTFFLLDAVLYGVPVLWTQVQHKYTWNWKGIGKTASELGFKNVPIKEILVQSVLLVALLITVNWGINALLAQTGMQALNDTANVERAVQRLRETVPWMLIYLLTVRVIGEEIFFRGFLVPKMGSMGSSILFGAVHAVYGSWVEVIGAIIMGFILAKVFEKNKTIYPNILGHMGYNVLVIYALQEMGI